MVQRLKSAAGQSAIVKCPNCSTRFVAPVEQFISSGRNVRCSNCRHQWFYSLGDETRDSNGQKRRRGARAANDASMHEPQLRRRSIIGRLLFWLFALGLLVSVLGYALRKPLLATFPQAGPIYEKIDTRFATARGNFDRLRPGGERASSLRVERTQYEIVETGSQRSALVTMSVVNEGTEPMSVPDVNIVVRGAGNTVLGETTASPSDADGGPLEAGASRDIAFEVPIDAGEVTSAELEFIAN